MGELTEKELEIIDLLAGGPVALSDVVGVVSPGSTSGYRRISSLKAKGIVRVELVEGRKLCSLVITQAEEGPEPEIDFSNIWQVGAGPYKDVFTAPVRGEQCLWSCTWAVKGGRVSPLDLGYVPDQMTREAVFYELLDSVYRGSDIAGNFIAKHLQGPDGDFVLPSTLEIERVLIAVRHSYVEYIWPYNPPDPKKVQLLQWRGGWQSNARMADYQALLARTKRDDWRSS